MTDSNMKTKPSDWQKINGMIVALSWQWRVCDCQRPCVICPLYLWQGCLIDVIEEREVMLYPAG